VVVAVNPNGATSAVALLCNADGRKLREGFQFG
jgi:hypothetical protein